MNGKAGKMTQFHAQDAKGGLIMKVKIEIKDIPIHELKIDEFNVRQGEWDENEELVNSIKQQGILEPLLVRPSNDKKNPYSIICGGRRWHAAIDAGLKVVPCVVREFSDLETLGTSLQENMQRGNLDRVQEAEGIAKIWEMMNGERSYQEKMKAIEKQFGIKETTTKRYLAISRLSDKIKEMIKSTPPGGRETLDTHVAADLSTSDWQESEKEEAAEILSRIESPEKRRKVLSQLKSYPELSPKEAYEKVKKTAADRPYSYDLPASLIPAFDKALNDVKLNMSWREIITEATTQWLKKRGYL